MFIVVGVGILEKYTDREKFHYMYYFLFISFLVYMLVRNIVMLNISRQLRSEFLHHKRKTVRAKVYKIRHTLNTSCAKKAWAKYSFMGKEHTGKMICAIDRELYEGNSYNVYTCTKYPEYFALSEQQAKDAVMTYLVLGILSFIGALCFVLIGILFIVSKFQVN